ncbi:hypothetical protein IC607_12550 [Cellulomonas sp. JH27-2]|uniref:hypothetical protein n=1 Tax=Cellulomonas sp. JH27-2 TaxID=2774139 RepID=UPI001786794B|nr:hypothetical protein [Cellulomonas sp. JH27-2]MBD8059797.1 hypothetical protein [Cellulomonas sp. JH27-2]
MRRLAALLGLALVAAVVLPAAPASAAARVTVTSKAGSAIADSTYSTTVTVRGSGFQSVKGGFGGIYVFFGWVDDPSSGSWRPSRGGVTGDDYLYVPDSESKDNQGFQRFVAFPGSSTESSANGGEISASGSWKTTLVIPGPTFQAADRSGKVRTVDCRELTCGVLTIGAHGVTNKNNETFTRVRFTTTKDATSGAQAAPTKGAPSAAGTSAGTGAGAGGGSGDAPTGAASPGAQPSPSSSAAAAPDVPATLGVSQDQVVVGRVLSFTGQGFQPGEQVVGTLGAGLAAVGPLTAGAQGEVAGVVQLPADLRPGTQAFTLDGAASGRSAAVEFTAIADPVSAAAAANASTQPVSSSSPWAVVVGVVALLLLAFVVASFTSARRRRRRRRPTTPRPGATA